MPLSRILVADTPEAVEVFRHALATPSEFATAGTLEEAKKKALEQVPALVVCGCHFDEGRMYDLLRFMKASEPLALVPFIAVRCVEGELALDDALYESVKIAVRALGGNGFVDLLRWQRRYGQADASHRLTTLIQSLAQAPPADTA